MESSPLERVEQLLLQALVTDGDHRKQWYLEEALKRVRGIIGRPFPDDLAHTWMKLPDGIYGAVSDHPGYSPGVAP